MTKLDKQSIPNPWRIVTWSDERGRVIRELAFHEQELPQVMELGMPRGAVTRDPVTLLTNLARAKGYQWHGRQPIGVGWEFKQLINQGIRECYVLAVDEKTGAYLYDYEMPNAGVFLRMFTPKAGHRPISRRKALPAKWQRLIDGDDF